MAGPFPALRNAAGRVILAWGSDHLRAAMVRGEHLPFDIIVLTAEGIQDTPHRLEANGYRVVRCGYDDSPDLSQARFKVERCAPEVAAAIKAGARALVLCAAGENRSAIMTSRIRYLLTGEAGTAIVASMRAVPRSEGHTFSNGVFRRWAESWPAKEPGFPGTPWTKIILAGIALLGVGGIFLATVFARPANPKKRKRRAPYKMGPTGYSARFMLSTKLQARRERLEAQARKAEKAVDKAYERYANQDEINMLETQLDLRIRALEDFHAEMAEREESGDYEEGDDPREGAGIEAAFAHIYAAFLVNSPTYAGGDILDALRGTLGAYDWKAAERATDEQLLTAAEDAYHAVSKRRQRNGRACDPLLWSQPRQAITSSKTALRQVPAIYKRVKLGRVNADIGGGPYQDATRYLRKRGTRNVVYDPFNRPSQENARAKSAICASRANTATAANVLNVIRSKSTRRRVIEQAADAIGKGGIAYFQVYEGDQSGRGKPTPRGWQENRRARSYLPEIRTVFRSTEQRGNIIAAWEPK